MIKIHIAEDSHVFVQDFLLYFHSSKALCSKSRVAESTMSDLVMMRVVTRLLPPDDQEPLSPLLKSRVEKGLQSMHGYSFRLNSIFCIPPSHAPKRAKLNSKKCQSVLLMCSWLPSSSYTSWTNVVKQERCARNAAKRRKEKRLSRASFES